MSSYPMKSRSYHGACSKSLRKRKGFTLIEMLIVITVIGILGAILFPVFGKVRENGRRTACASNMKQLAMAFLQYAQDYNDRLPGATDAGLNGTDQGLGENRYGGWVFYTQRGDAGSFDDAAVQKATFDVTQGTIYPYVRSTAIYLCPSDTYGPQLGTTGLSYAVNACVSKQTRDAAGVRDITGFQIGKKLNLLKNPSQFMLIAEELQPGSDGSGGELDDTSTDDGYFNLRIDAQAAESSHRNYLALRHNEGGNVAFVDGHVKWYKRDQIIQSKLQIGGEGDLAKGCPEFQAIPSPTPPPP